MERKKYKWEIKANDVARTGQKLGQGGFGAVFKGYASSLLDATHIDNSWLEYGGGLTLQ